MKGIKSFCNMASFYNLNPIKLGCEVRGINLVTEGRPEGKY